MNDLDDLLFYLTNHEDDWDAHAVLADLYLDRADEHRAAIRRSIAQKKGVNLTLDELAVLLGLVDHAHLVAVQTARFDPWRIVRANTPHAYTLYRQEDGKANWADVVKCPTHGHAIDLIKGILEADLRAEFMVRDLQWGDTLRREGLVVGLMARIRTDDETLTRYFGFPY